MGKVLIVDGTAGGRELLRILLEHEGYEVVEATNAVEALTVARVTLPDIILLDLDLPGAGGYAAVQGLRLDQELKNRPIMAVTDSTRKADRERILNAGFTGYIAKPVVLRNLREQLTQLGALRREA